MNTKQLQLEIRLRAARIIHQKSSHIGGVFSSADILALLYGEILSKMTPALLILLFSQKGIAAQESIAP